MACGPEIHQKGIFRTSKKRGTIEGPIRIPLDSVLFLFNALALLRRSSKSLKFRLALLSTSTRLRQISFRFSGLTCAQGNGGEHCHRLMCPWAVEAERLFDLPFSSAQEQQSCRWINSAG